MGVFASLSVKELQTQNSRKWCAKNQVNSVQIGHCFGKWIVDIYRSIVSDCHETLAQGIADLVEANGKQIASVLYYPAYGGGRGIGSGAGGREQMILAKRQGAHGPAWG